MKIVKLFETSKMTGELFEILRQFGCFMEDGAIDYVVGYIFEDSQDPSAKLLDDWFIANGARMKERVLIYHGSFALLPMKYFVVRSKQGKYCTGYYGWDSNIHSDHQIFKEDELPFDIDNKDYTFIQVGEGEKPSPYNVQEMLHE